MKILIVNTYDIDGGAGRAASRLHRSLLSEGIDSQMLVIYKCSDDFTIRHFAQNFGKIKNRLRELQFKFLNRIKNYPKKTKTYYSASFLGFSNIVDTINEINPDIVHLHWICNEMIKIEDLAKIHAPIVWSLHDMWPFTGGCHYDEECGRYVDSCGSCKVLGSEIGNDLSKIVFDRKQKTYAKINNMTIVGLSHWLSSCAQNSSLFKDNKIVTIPNPIDSDKFKPLDKSFSRDAFSLPIDRKLIMFGAIGATSDPRKGFQILQEAINKIPESNIELVVFGSSKPETPPKLKFKTHYLGQFDDDISLQTLYSACDVLVVPSLQENLSNTIMESLSCGTPVVGFSIGGNVDMIEHKKNGYIANAFDTADLANGIQWILNNDAYVTLCENARVKVLAEFDSFVVSKRYIQLYREIFPKNNIKKH